MHRGSEPKPRRQEPCAAMLPVGQNTGGPALPRHGHPRGPEALSEDGPAPPSTGRGPRPGAGHTYSERPQGPRVPCRSTGTSYAK